MMAFSLAYYRTMLGNLQASNWAFHTVAQLLQLVSSDTRGICVLRHDVDRLPWRAVAMARLENSVEIRSTYYFRCNKFGLFPAPEIRAIAALGHEVGYHYETLSQFEGDLDAAFEAFIRNLSRFREIETCQSVSMHGAPLSRHDNQKLIEGIDLAALDLRGDAVRDLRRFQPLYITDTGGNWNSSGHRNRRDIAGEMVTSAPDFLDAQAIANFSAENRRLLYINSHPERWASSGMGALQASATDMLSNTAKRMIRLFQTGQIS